jgi:hypothetical protein
MAKQLNAHGPQENRNVVLSLLPKQKNPCLQAERNFGENVSARYLRKADPL